MKKIKLIEVKSEIGAGTRGASLGVDALKIAALDFGSNYFIQYPSVEIPNENNLLFEPAGSPFAKRIKGIHTMYERISKEVINSLKEGFFPIIISGDHSTSGGSVSGVKMAYPEARIGVIWIDAHADIHSPYTTPSGNMHGMPIAALLAEDNLPNKINAPDEQTVDYWKKIKKLGKIAPKIQYEDLVYITVRDTEPAEDYLIKLNKVKLFTMAQIKKVGIEKVARETAKYLEHCDYIYISFDVDSMDSAICRGTGTPVPNGLSEKEAGNLLVMLMQNEKVNCFEITEVNPTLDRENLTAENAFEILQRITNQLLIN